LFGGDPRIALGKDIRITRTVFKVIGVVKRDGQQDDLTIMPLGAARSYLLGGTNSVNSITVTAASAGQVQAALDEVTKILTERHNIKDPAKRDFEAQSLQNLLETANQFLGYLTLFTAAIAAISLIVGAIGIANIMLVSVTERTREIGIRKALGARRSAILKQFLIESTVLSVFGGFAGIAIGVGISVTAAALLPAAVPDFPAPQFSITPIVLAFAISLGIGLIAGVYPANRAARLRPIEALRYE
jgi:putative ABC transport system permease protein